MLQWELDDYEQMLSSAQESLALALEVSTKKDIAIARDYVGAALALLGEDQQARTLLEQSFADFQELNDPFWQAFCFQLLAYLLMKQGALTYHNRFSRVLEFARKAGERWLMANALNRYAKRLMRLNRFDEAKEYIEEADRLCKQLGLENSSDVSLSLAQIAWCNGDTQEVTSRLTELQERFKVLGYKSLRARCLSDLGWLAMEEGNLQEAQLFLEQGLALMRETGFKPDIVPCLIRLSHLSYLQRNLEAFKQYFRESFSLRSYLSNYDKTYMLMTVLGSLYFQNSETSALLMGVAASFEKEDDLPLIVIEKPYWNRAESHARKSLGDAAFESAFAQGQKMSLDDGLDFAMKTVEEITESKLPPDTAIEDSIIPAIFPSQREVEKQKYGGLTTREREVAAQIAQGKSNQTIAAELFVGLKTVETHVTHILAKLGFTSRAQIAGWAVAKGLAEGPQDVNSPSREG